MVAKEQIAIKFKRCSWYAEHRARHRLERRRAKALAESNTVNNGKKMKKASDHSPPGVYRLQGDSLTAGRVVSLDRTLLLRAEIPLRGVVEGSLCGGNDL
jgi:hypothetical protein